PRRAVRPRCSARCARLPGSPSSRGRPARRAAPRAAPPPPPAPDRSRSRRGGPRPRRAARLEARAGNPAPRWHRGTPLDRSGGSCNTDTETAMGRLVDALLAEAPGARQPPEAVPDDAEAVLAHQIAAGRAAWPQIRVDDADFARFLAHRVGHGEDLVAELRELPAADLYLACACAAGDPRAIAAFEAAYFANVDTAVAAMRAPFGSADEVKQILRTRFFVPVDGRPPAIADFG